MDYEKGYASNEAVPRPETFIDPLHRADDSLTEAMKRASLLADRLCGAQPTNQTASKLASVPAGGVLPEVGMIGQRMHDKLGEVHEALARIERSLP